MSANRRRALLSVSDRTGIVELATALLRHGFEVVSTGGTAAHLAAAGIAVTSVTEVTGFPEVFGGRVKTLHPMIFGGVLQDRSEPLHLAEAEANGVAPIDVVAVNLYPFEATVAVPGVSRAQAIEKIDVGGPSLIRAAAKNSAHVAVLCDPADYGTFVEELDRLGGTTEPSTRHRLAAKAFRRTAAYDAAIAEWLSARDGEEEFPETVSVRLDRVASLRYGENPHQKAAFYREPSAPASSFARFEKVQGKELSYNNLLDADSALFSARLMGPRAMTIVKHRVACGIAAGDSFAEALEAAWASDPVSGFGGVLAWTGVLDEAGAEALGKRFLEVIVAETVTGDARAVLARKPGLRVLTVPAPGDAARVRELRGVEGGLLLQEPDRASDDEAEWRVVSRRQPSASERAALSFVSRAVRGVISNAIVIGGASATYGIGGGRTSRVDACKDAVSKAGARARGAVAASDAFFPFPDGLEALADAGVAAVVEPGGSVRDAEVIAAADARDLALVFTGRRHFRH